MTKWNTLLISTIILILFSISVSSLEICSEDSVKINTNCTFFTPELICSLFNYTILNLNGSVPVNEQDLTLFSGNIYTFNFTEPTGSYIIRLCDGTTREVKVKKGDFKVFGIMILMVLVIGGYLYISFSLNNKHWISKIILMFGGLFNITGAFLIGIAELNNSENGTLQILEILFSANLLIIFIIMSYFILFVLKSARGIKEARENEDD